METLVLDRQGIELDVQEGRLLVRHPDPSRSLSLPVQQLQQVLVLSPITLNSRVIALLAKYHIACLFADGSGPMPVITPLPPVHGQRITGQVAIATTPAIRQAEAQKLVITKVRRQQDWLARHDPQAAEALSAIVDRLIARPAQLQTLLGLEGSAAKITWQSFARQFSASLGFTGRKRRPPKDPVNSILSLSASLAQREVVMVLRTWGLDPFLGIYHTCRPGRESLGWDMVELIRPQLEQWAYEDFYRATLNCEHFSIDPIRGCRLNKTGRVIWFALWAKRRKILRRYLVRVVREWAAMTELHGKLLENSLKETAVF